MLETAADRAAYLTAFGSSATWTKSTGATAAVKVIYHLIYQDVGSSVSDHIAQTSTEEMGAVKLRETLTISGTVFTVIDIRPDGSNWLELQLDR